MIVTVVTPTLNGMPYLRECIESVRKNGSRNVEVEHVIVDGGSTDGTIELAQSYGLPLLTGKDKGIFDAINKGSFNSRGELLGFLGSDDVMLDGALDAVVEAYRASGRRWVVGGIHWIDEHGNSLGQLRAPPTWMTVRMHACLEWNPIMHMATYFSREFYTELGGFNIDYKDSGDFDMFARALSQEPFGRIGRQIAAFRRTGSNNSVVNRARGMREAQTVYERFGATSAVEHQLWRYLLKCWFNFSNPDWMAHKVSNSLLLRLQPQKKSYF